MDDKSHNESEINSKNQLLFSILQVLLEFCISIATTGQLNIRESFQLSVISKLKGKLKIVIKAARISEAEVYSAESIGLDSCLRAIWYGSSRIAWQIEARHPERKTNCAESAKFSTGKNMNPVNKKSGAVEDESNWSRIEKRA